MEYNYLYNNVFILQNSNDMIYLRVHLRVCTYKCILHIHIDCLIQTRLRYLIQSYPTSMVLPTTSTPKSVLHTEWYFIPVAEHFWFTG
jgi:hypothetical protein